MVHTSAEWNVEAQAFIARYRDIHTTQAQGAREELARLASLIADAGERLMASFNVIAEMSAGRAAVPPADITDAVDNAMRALQFQDMATQLVGHAVKRIELLQRIAEPLQRLPAVSARELDSAIAGGVHERESGPVAQGCMSGGSIDLF